MTTETRKRRKYTDEDFKRDAVALVTETICARWMQLDKRVLPPIEGHTTHSETPRKEGIPGRQGGTEFKELITVTG
jgi:hypothetical protein